MRAASRCPIWVGMVWVLGCGAEPSSPAPAANVPSSSAMANPAPSANPGGSRAPAANGGGGASGAAAGMARPAQDGGATAVTPPASMGAAGRAGSMAPGTQGAAAGSGMAGPGNAAAAGGGASPVPADKFSFFVTSLESMRELSGAQEGFGGDLRFGEATGLAGADKICGEIAERSLKGARAKGWRAFLSAKAGGPSGGAVNARDRIGSGPWYDRNGRLVAKDLPSLLGTRPAADSAIANDLPNERGEPNHGSQDVDNHDTVTGSDAQGNYAGGPTCEDWTSTETPMTSTMPSMGIGRGGAGHNGPMCGHSWPAMSGMSWIMAHPAPGCSPSVSLMQNGAGSGTGIGNGGGYGGIYCFALMP